MKQRHLISQEEYAKKVKDAMPKQKVVRNTFRAFWVGGVICMIGQAFGDWFRYLGLDDKGVSAAASIVMVFLGALLTGLNLYAKIGKYAGAGSIVPITGFANSMVSPAMEFKREGFIMGTGGKLFALAGPVLVFGISSSVLVGIIAWLIGPR